MQSLQHTMQSLQHTMQSLQHTNTAFSFIRLLCWFERGWDGLGRLGGWDLSNNNGLQCTTSSVECD